MLDDATKEQEENDHSMRHWQAEHDKLTLVDVEYVLTHYLISFTNNLDLAMMMMTTTTTSRMMRKMAGTPIALKLLTTTTTKLNPTRMKTRPRTKKMAFVSTAKINCQNSGKRSYLLTPSCSKVKFSATLHNVLQKLTFWAEKLQTAKPNLSVLDEYKQRQAEFDRRAQDLEDVTAKRDKQKMTYDGLRKQRLDEFMAGFNLISLKLKEMYQV